MSELNKNITGGILGLNDTKPVPERNRQSDDYDERDDANWRPGSRDVDEGGGVASEVSGTRNQHATGGATGGDLGNRPE